VTYDEYNEFCGSLQATSYVVQWGNSHVWTVVDKVFAIGVEAGEKRMSLHLTSKRPSLTSMFCEMNWDSGQRPTWPLVV